MGGDEVAGIIARSVKQRYEWMVALGKTAPASATLPICQCCWRSPSARR